MTRVGLGGIGLAALHHGHVNDDEFAHGNAANLFALPRVEVRITGGFFFART
jgi:hypothetical protein